ncbi:MAG: 4-hydroxy-tetrahydrodipicolinate reductase [Betaproteobacteria bacterium]
MRAEVRDAQGQARMRVVVAGAAGRMGRMLIAAICAAPDAELTGALEVIGHPLVGRDAGESLGLATAVAISDNLALSLAHADVLIDFTTPAATLGHAQACAARGVALVVGTTGLDAHHKEQLARASALIGIVLAPNMSVGVSVNLQLLEIAARLLGQSYDVEIVEAHHRHKVDAPSGTALAMGEAVARGLGCDLQPHAVFARHGHTGPRPERAIGFSTIRGGDIVGDHTVMFIGSGERIEITHRSSSRENYAQGSLRACRFLHHQGPGPGLYTMRDVLGLGNAR